MNHVDVGGLAYMGRFRIFSSFLLAIFGLVSCSGSRTEAVSLIQERQVRETVLEPVRRDTVIADGVMGSIIPMGDIFVANELARGSEFRLYLLDSGKQIISRFARRGNGPGEYTACMVPKQFTVSGNAIRFTVLDNFRGLRNGYEYVTGLDSVPRLTSSVELPQLYQDLRVLYDTEKGHCAVLLDNAQTVVLSDAGYDNVRTVEIQDRDEDHGFITYQGNTCISEDGGTLVLTYFYMPRVDFVSTDGSKVHSVYYKEVVTGDVVDNAEVRVHYMNDVASTGKSVYCLMEREGERDGKSAIIHLDLSGKYRGTYLIDKASSISASGNKIYTTSGEEEVTVVSEYTIPG